MNPEYIRLSNKHYLLSESYIPDLEKVPTLAKGGIKWRGKDTPKEGHRLQPAAVQALCDMNAEIRALAEEMGFRDMYLKSAYRSYRTQRTMYRNRLAKNNGKDDGWVSMPGASDHQTGLGLDIVPSNWKDRGMNDKMMKEPECQWMAEHCQEYGFIIRYPADKNEITEINTEPWHLRYVGIPVATYIMENGLCLEEFTWQLQEAIQASGDTSLDLHVKEELGDLLFAVTNLARHLKCDAESAVEGTTAKFARRFRAVEAAAKAQGRDLKSMTLAEMDALWEAAKQSEHDG
jgi:D-alanyl-D-alanine carboxypeptidase